VGLCFNFILESKQGKSGGGSGILFIPYLKKLKRRKISA